MASPGPTDEWRGLAYGLIGVVMFGLTLPATRLAVADLDPIFVALGRALFAAVPAALVLWLTRAPWPKRADLRPLAVTALGVIFGFPVLVTIAMQTVPAAHGGVVLAILPLATAAAGVWFARERPSSGFWLCAIAGSASVLAFILIAGGSEALTIAPADLLLLGAVAAAAVGYAQGGVLARKLGGWQVISWVLVLTAPLSAAILLAFEVPIAWQARPSAWFGFLYVAIGSQFLGFFAWYAGLALGGVARVGQLQLLQTFVTLAGAGLMAGEAVGWLEAGFAVLVVAIVAIGRRMPVQRDTT